MKKPKIQIPNLKLQEEALGLGASEWWDEPAPASEPQLAGEARVLYRETKEPVLIFANMSRK